MILGDKHETRDLAGIIEHWWHVLFASLHGKSMAFCKELGIPEQASPFASIPCGTCTYVYWSIQASKARRSSVRAMRRSGGRHKLTVATVYADACSKHATFCKDGRPQATPLCVQTQRFLNSAMRRYISSSYLLCSTSRAGPPGGGARSTSMMGAHGSLCVVASRGRMELVRSRQHRGPTFREIQDRLGRFLLFVPLRESSPSSRKGGEAKLLSGLQEALCRFVRYSATALKSFPPTLSLDSARPSGCGRDWNARVGGSKWAVGAFLPQHGTICASSHLHPLGRHVKVQRAIVFLPSFDKSDCGSSSLSDIPFRPQTP